MKEHASHNPSSPVPYRERALSPGRLRRLLRNTRSGSIPSSLVEVISESFPVIHAPDVAEVLSTLRKLVGEVTVGLENEGVIPEAEGFHDDGSFRLTTRERSQVASLSALLSWTADAGALLRVTSAGEIQINGESLVEEIDRLNHRAINLARLADSPRQLAVALMVRADHAPLLPEDNDAREKLEKEAISLLEEETGEFGDQRLLADVHLRIANTYFTKGLVERSEEHLAWIERLVENDRENHYAAYSTPLHRLRSAIAARRSDLRTALVEARSALRTSDPTIDPITHAQVLHSLGRVYGLMEHREEELQSYLDAVTVLEEAGLLSFGPWVGFSAAKAYQVAEEYDEAEQILDRIGETLGITDLTNLPASPTVEIVSLIASRADLWSRTGEVDRALHLFDWAIEQFHTRDAPFNEATVCGMAALTLAGRGEHDAACGYLERAVAVSSRSSTSNRLRFYLQLAEELIAADHPERAGILLDEIESDLDPATRPAIQFSRLRSRLCELSGEIGEALRLEREAAVREQELFSHDRKRSVRYGRIVAEINLLEQTIEKERDQKQRLEHALANAVVELGAKKETIEKIVEVLRQEATRPGSDDDRATSTRFASILASLRARQDSSSTLTFLGPAADEFMTLLRTDYPHLTISQQRFCALIRFGYDSSEICSILEIGREGLKSRRKRLRKGLGLETGESLEEAVARIGKE